MKQLARIQQLHKRQIYEKHLKMRTFKLLLKLQAFLREENKIIEAQ
jgi:hypothetical protein